MTLGQSAVMFKRDACTDFDHTQHPALESSEIAVSVCDVVGAVGDILFAHAFLHGRPPRPAIESMSARGSLGRIVCVKMRGTGANTC